MPGVCQNSVFRRRKAFSKKHHKCCILLTNLENVGIISPNRLVQLLLLYLKADDRSADYSRTLNNSIADVLDKKMQAGDLRTF